MPRQWLVALVPAYASLGEDILQAPASSLAPWSFRGDLPDDEQLELAGHMAQADLALEQGRWTLAAGLLGALARAGHPDAQYRLGLLHLYGRGVPENDVLAAQWYFKAAEQGHAQAQHDLGILHQLGRGVARDRQSALEWYRKAALQGWGDAQARLRAIGEVLPEAMRTPLPAAH